MDIDAVSDMVEVKQVTLEIKTWGINFISPEYDVHPDIINRYTHSLRQRILGRTLEEIEIKYSINTWEHFKEKYLPEWFKNKWPVRYYHKIVKIDALYPEMAIPDSRSFVVAYIEPRGFNK